ncbi:NAD(P)/FAD-dependent oxidoreductase [Marinobacter sp. 1_MG-2023]|uniref:NAD(P)/FAD-dependent oxidoreductase n=1 Tax=Marinobacter sp. 1_MG-2023 TaxID=3062627 RepID=UPI0026E1356D|nr:NAD(P)/FAD-dependent oxidoreductase [Marinobacter sp. 1_MG-2023]MDO6823206.1 NAD(P)/FAD-dependent oxidoreductase [Marinobacter sp. 1_MG-2023]
MAPSIPSWQCSRNAGTGCFRGFRPGGYWGTLGFNGFRLPETGCRQSKRQQEYHVTSDLLEVDTLVIGAGVVGLAVARTLARSGREVIVLEAGSRFGEGISSRNSEVIHAGIYYPQNSLKARLCVEGRRQLYDFCESHRVGYRKCGKWVIATNDAQNRLLEGIQLHAAANDVPLSLVGGKDVARQLPGVRVTAGLWSPETGILDTHGLMLALLGELEDAGGSLALHSPVERIESAGDYHLLQVAGASPCTLKVRSLVNAAGLGAVPLTRSWLGFPDEQRPSQWLARGVYFSYSGRHPFRNLIYPVPEPGGLGVHLTLDLAGQARFGPDVEWIEREDYSVDPERVGGFAAGIKQWWPGLEVGRLQPAYAGIRPKLKDAKGGFFDFRVDGPDEHGVPGLVNLFGIESPGLTSCLAIAGLVKNKLA